MSNNERDEAMHIASVGVWITPYCAISLPDFAENTLRPRLDRRTKKGKEQAKIESLIGDLCEAAAKLWFVTDFDPVDVIRSGPWKDG